MAKRLYRSRRERILGGVCGGLGRYFDLDPTLVRLLWVLGFLVTGCFPMFIAYVVAWVIIPEDDGVIDVERAGETGRRVDRETGR